MYERCTSCILPLLVGCAQAFFLHLQVFLGLARSFLQDHLKSNPCQKDEKRRIFISYPTFFFFFFSNGTDSSYRLTLLLLFFLLSPSFFFTVGIAVLQAFCCCCCPSAMTYLTRVGAKKALAHFSCAGLPHLSFQLQSSALPDLSTPILSIARPFLSTPILSISRPFNSNLKHCQTIQLQS